MVELDKEGTAQHGTTRLEVDFLAGKKGYGGVAAGFFFDFAVRSRPSPPHLRLLFLLRGNRQSRGAKRGAGRKERGRKEALGGTTSVVPRRQIHTHNPTHSGS